MAARPPPLLLTKRLTSFLQLNLSAHAATTLLLLTPDGRLLAYASNPPIPVATLRTHGTVAASLYAIHSAGTDPDTIQTALSGRAQQQPRQQQQQQAPPLAVTIQLESGTVLVVRRLRCGMLLASMGSPDAAAVPPQTTTTRPTAAGLGQIVGAAAGAASSENNNSGQTPSTSPPPPVAHPGSPSDVASVLSNATAQTSASSVTGTAGVMATRRHAEELARWLDEKLGALEIPSDGLGGPV